MAGWTDHIGRVLVLDVENIDTDQLIPARFMSTPRSKGYGDYLLHDMRRDEAGVLDPAFPLNQNKTATVLIAGRNFGTGSSREAAVYALVDAGFRAVIAPSFGDIFSSNAVNNGLLPAKLLEQDIDQLCDALEDAKHNVAISLMSNTIQCGPHTFPFELDKTWCTKLRNGWDDIDLTLNHVDEIASFRHDRNLCAPWAFLRHVERNQS